MSARPARHETYATLEEFSTKASAAAFRGLGTASALCVMESPQGRAHLMQCIVMVQLAAHALNPTLESPLAKLDRLVAHLSPRVAQDQSEKS